MNKLITIAMLGAVSVPMLTALGCSTGGNQPYSLTGTSAQQAAAQHEEWRQRMMYTDDKGHYRADLRQQGAPPLRYIPR